MAMSVTITEERNFDIQQVKAVVVSAADGSASGATPHRYNGMIFECAVVPDAGGKQPTNAFDLTITDANGLDVLCGAGADLSNAAPTYLVSELGMVAGDALTFNIANAGDTKGVTVYLFIG